MGKYLDKGLGRYKIEELSLLGEDLPTLKAKALHWEDIPEGKGVVCIFRNGPFDAAMWCYCPEELKYAQESIDDPKDRRLKVFLLLPLEKIKELAG